MACVPEEIANPLNVIDRLFANHQANTAVAELPAQWGERAHFVQALGLHDEENFAKIPCINDMEFSSSMVPFTLVRYRALVQDVFEPEIYGAVFEEHDDATSQEARPARMLTSKYRECVGPAPGRLMKDIGPDGFGQRGACYCVPIPGETSWAQTSAVDWARARGYVPVDSSAPAARKSVPKRTRDDDDVDMSGEFKDTGTTPSATRKSRNLATVSTVPPRAVAGQQRNDLCSADEFGLNLPLPSEERRGAGASTVAIVKLYDEDAESVRLCDTIEVVGVLCIDPQLANFDTTPLAQAGIGQDARTPSASLVPRLHALMVRRLPYYNPLLPYSPNWLNESRLAAACQGQLGAPGAFSAAWRVALAQLTKGLAGDALAAQYMLLQLVSRIFGKHGDTQLGNWSMSLAQWPEGAAVSDLRNAVAEIAPRAVHLQMSANSLNTLKWRPRKDFIANRLVAGQLQLAPGTHLLVDETPMAEGQLQVEGVKSLSAIGTLVTERALACDFTYDVKVPLELSCTVVTSQRNPIVKAVDIALPLRPNAANAAEAAALPCDADALNAARFVLALVTRSPKPVDVPDAVAHQFSEDFSAIRQEIGVPAELCHTWLCLARAACLWHGEAALSAERWRSVLEMERERLRRCMEDGLLQAR